MTRLFNDPVNYRTEFLLGLVAAYPSPLRAVPGGTCVVSTSAPTEGRIGVVIGVDRATTRRLPDWAARTL